MEKNRYHNMFEKKETRTKRISKITVRLKGLDFSQIQQCMLCFFSHTLLKLQRLCHPYRLMKIKT